MKYPSQNEVEEGTFQINSPKRHSHSTQIKLDNCVRQIMDGQNLETVCERVFGKVTDVRLEDIRNEIAKQYSKKDETVFVCRHRNDLKKSHGFGRHETTLDNPKNSDGPEKNHKEKTFPDNRRVHYE